MRFWPILILLVVLNVCVATLMILAQGKPSLQPKPRRAGSSLSTRSMPVAKGDAYNYRYMAFGGALMAGTAVGLVWFLRRYKPKTAK